MDGRKFIIQIREIVGWLFLAAFVVFYSSIMKADLVKESYVEFPFASVESLNYGIKSGKIQLATSQPFAVNTWLSDAKLDSLIELRNTLKKHPYIQLKRNGDFCAYRNHSDFSLI